MVIGKDPRDIELINCHLRTQTVQSRGGINRQAVAAIENALLDIKGKALGVPVYDLFGRRCAQAHSRLLVALRQLSRALSGAARACRGWRAMTISRVSPKK